MYLKKGQSTKVSTSKKSVANKVKEEKINKTINGEQIAKETFDMDIFNNIDCVYSSNYIRTISTAKYIAEKNNLEINIADDLGERKFGISSWDELLTNFERKQFLDKNYKLGNGENQK